MDRNADSNSGKTVSISLALPKATSVVCRAAICVLVSTLLISGIDVTVLIVSGMLFAAGAEGVPFSLAVDLVIARSPFVALFCLATSIALELLFSKKRSSDYDYSEGDNFLVDVALGFNDDGSVPEEKSTAISILEKRLNKKRIPFNENTLGILKEELLREEAKWRSRYGHHEKSDAFLPSAAVLIAFAAIIVDILLKEQGESLAGIVLALVYLVVIVIAIVVMLIIQKNIRDKIFTAQNTGHISKMIKLRRAIDEHLLKESGKVAESNESTEVEGDPSSLVEKSNAEQDER